MAKDAAYVYYLFIYSSVDVHSDCLHVSYCEQSCSDHRGARVPFESEFCLDICSGVGLLDHMAVLFLAF